MYTVHPSVKSPAAKPESCLLKKLLPDTSVLQQETYSRKVFVGGLPSDIDQGMTILSCYIFTIKYILSFVEEIRMSFQRFGAVSIDWPHKMHSKSRVPPKGAYYYVIIKLAFHDFTC